MSYDNDHPISELIGRTITHVDGAAPESCEITFTCSDGTRWRMLHEQDCCESVYVYDVIGDVNDLIGAVLDAREESNSERDPADVPPPEYGRDSFTWTFYIIQTDKGAVTLRWLGESNGYYSERVDFEQLENAL